MKKNLDFNKIASFVRVVDAGSITRAAQFLHQPKSRVSRNIAALERELGIALLYRTTRQFNVTEAGRTLYDRCRDKVYSLEEAAHSLRESSHEVAGLLQLTAAEDVGAILFGGLFAEFKAMHPKVTFNLVLSNDYVDLVKEGIDLALRIGALEDTSLKSRYVGKTASVLVASPAYLDAAPKIIEPRDLLKHEALVFTAELEDGCWPLTAAGKKKEQIRIKPSCTATNPIVPFELALLGRGVALIPESMCIESIRTGALTRVLPEYSSPPIPVHFVWPGQKEMMPKVRAFIDFGVTRLSGYFS